MADTHTPSRIEAGDSSTKPTTEQPAEAVPNPIRERVHVGTGLSWGLIVGIVLAVMLVVLAAQNTDSTTIAFLGWDFSTPLIVVILATLVVGVAFDKLFGLVYRARRRRMLNDRDELKRLKRSPGHTH